MPLNKEYDRIINACKEKYYYAIRKEQTQPKDDEYLWLLGIDVFKDLEYGFGADVVVHHLHNPENNVYQLMGIDIQIDYEHKDIIKLYKEV